MGYEFSAISSGDQQQRQRNIEKLKRELGPDILTHLADPTVVEIMANPNGSLWLDRAGEGMRQFGVMPTSQVESIVGTVAYMLRATVTEEKPILEGELPLDGSRFSAAFPPIVSPQPSFTIRKKPARIFTLDEYLAAGVIDPRQHKVVVSAIAERKNICVVGGTGSGKTTLTNGIINEISMIHPDDRLVMIEDTLELKCAAENNVILRTSLHVSMAQLIKATLRLRPTRILVGEVRDGAALDLIMAWNTGHPGGVTTFHCDSAAAGLTRLEALVRMATDAPMQAMIAEAIDLIVFIQKVNEPPYRRITSMMEVIGFDGRNYITNPL